MAERKRAIIPIGIYDSALSNTTYTAEGASIYVLPQGATVKTGAASGNSSVVVYDPGGLSSTDEVKVYDLSGSGVGGLTDPLTELTTPLSSLTISTVAYNSSTDDWTITFSGTFGFDINNGDRLAISYLNSGDYLTLYSAAKGAGTISNPISVPANGIIDFYAEAEGFDIYIGAGTASIDPGYYQDFFDIPTIPVGTDNRFILETVDAPGTTHTMDEDTGILVITGGATLTTLDECEPGRVVYVMSGDGNSVSLAYSAVSAAGKIYSSLAGSLTIRNSRPSVLVGRLVSGEPMWMPVNATGFLSEMGDVTVSTPASGDVLKYDGSGWVNSEVIGAAANPIIGYIKTGTTPGGASYFARGNGFGFYLNSTVTANRTITVPDTDGTLCYLETAQTITGLKTVYDSALEIVDAGDPTAKVSWDLQYVATGTDRAISAAPRTMDMHNLASFWLQSDEITGAGNYPLGFFPYAGSIAEVYVAIDGTTYSGTIQIRYGAASTARLTTGGTDVWAAPYALATNSSIGYTITSFNNSAPNNHLLWLDVTAAAGTINSMRVHIRLVASSGVFANGTV